MVQIVGFPIEHEWIDGDTFCVRFGIESPDRDESLPCYAMTIQRRENGMHVIDFDDLNQRTYMYLMREFKHLMKKEYRAKLEEFISPSGRFKIFNDTVIRVSDGKILKNIELTHQYDTWIEKDGHEWAVLNTNQGCLVLNCDTLVELKCCRHNVVGDWCLWTEVWSSPDGKTAAVVGRSLTDWGIYMGLLDISNLPYYVDMIVAHDSEFVSILLGNFWVEIGAEPTKHEWIDDNNLRVEVGEKIPGHYERLPCRTMHVQKQEDGMHVINFVSLTGEPKRN